MLKATLSTPLLILALFCCVASAEDTDVVPVTVVGESAISFEDATAKALRNAVRQAVGVVVAAETKTADFMLIREAVLTRSAGYVQSHKELDRKKTLDGIYTVKIHAECARGKMCGDWLAIKNLIEYLGRPQFAVSVTEKAGCHQGVGTWTEGAFNDELDKIGLSVLHGKTAGESIKRQYDRAVAAGDTKKANQLKLQMGAPYGVEIVAFGKTSQEDLYGVATNISTAELQVTVAHRDSGAILASKSTTGKAASSDTSAMQAACKDAVARVFPEVLDRILYHWTEDLDTGAAIAVQLFDVPFDSVSKLAAKLRTIEDVNKVNVTEAPENGIAALSVIGRVKAEDLANQIPGLMGGGYRAAMEGPRVVTVRPAEKAVAGAGEAGGTPPVAGTGGGSSGYVLPAAIVGACLLAGIVIAALLRRKAS